MRNIDPERPDAIPIEMLFASGEGAPSLEEKVALARAFCRTRERAVNLNQLLIRHADSVGRAVADAQENQRKLKALCDQLMEPPWTPAIFLRLVDRGSASRALVMHGSGQRVVGGAEGIDLEALRIGDPVFLAKEGNAIVACSAFNILRCGETAYFERDAADGRIVLKWRDEEVVVDRAASLAEVSLKRGDQVRWDRSAWLAFERIERADGRQFLLEEVPDIGRDRVGGHDAVLDALLGCLSATLTAPELAARYGLGSRHSILMYGPPGCGKTLMARVAAAELQRISGKRCRIGVVKPAEWESPYVGETTQNIIRCFRTLREAAAGGPAILFLDEIEAVGRIRGGTANVHSDKFLASLLAELDGFTDRAGIAIIAATNRKDLVDPALLERLSDLEIHVRRPRLPEARAIFDIHLRPNFLYSPNGAAASATREEIIETAVSRLYGPNAANELCTLRFRDGKTRVVSTRELASGRTFEQICRTACRAAFLRDVQGGEPGVCLADMEDAIAQTMERISTTLTVRNAHAYLPDLPQDVDVVSVDPVERRPARPHRYVMH